MSEHELPDEDGALSELYRRSAAATPSPHLDAQVISQARRQSLQIRDARMRHWLPVASVAVVVMAVGLLLYVVQAPPLQPPSMVQLSPLTVEEAPAAAPTMAPPAKAESRAPESQEVRPKSRKRVEPPESVFDDANEGEAPAKARVLAEPLGEVETKRQEGVPLVAAGEMAMPEEVATRAATSPADSAEVWMKRIRELYGKGDLDAARRELAAFRKAYPKWVVPKDLLPLLPEADR